MKKQTIKKSLAVAGLCLGSASVQAQTVTLLDENFDDASNTTIQSLLLSNPASLPSGTTWSSTGNANAVNLRLGTDAINTYNAGNPYQRFSIASGTTFFNNASTNKFLVMGDDSGQLAGNPTSGTFGFATPFSLASGTTDITVSFDWVFSDFGSGGDADQFKVGVTGAGFDIGLPLISGYSVLNKTITNNGKEYGIAATFNIAVASLGFADANGQYWLSFGLLENASSNNSAVGIDNIKITANVAPVPVPAAVWSFLAGFMGLLALGKRKHLTA
ncbi:MAG: hypothetical protein CTY19_09345 [Methylomonas sp.]|nr:MAG: hypothetical protein CTY19_09345 [Methylomonas sp.]